LVLVEPAGDGHEQEMEWVHGRPAHGESLADGPRGAESGIAGAVASRYNVGRFVFWITRGPVHRAGWLRVSLRDRVTQSRFWIAREKADVFF
jgi:hypothetical protein